MRQIESVQNAQLAKPRVGVLMGGRSRERAISLKTGSAVLAALERLGYAAKAIDVDESFLLELPKLEIDLAFIALHGAFGEDGRIQALLEWQGIPYTGSGVLTSALCMRKDRLKRFLAASGVSMAHDATYVRDAIFGAGAVSLADRPRLRDAVRAWIETQTIVCPVVVKPASEGSSIGMARVFQAEELLDAILEAAMLDTCVLIEAYIEGRELTVGVLDGDVLPVLEVVPEGGVYDYHAKYEVKTTRYIFPDDLPAPIQASLARASLQIYRDIEARGAVRIDWMWNPSSAEPTFLEVNTIPGMTETSLLPKAAAKVGLSFDDLVERMLRAASVAE